jgi:hypothetical protein
MYIHTWYNACVNKRNTHPTQIPSEKCGGRLVRPVGGAERPDQWGHEPGAGYWCTLVIIIVCMCVCVLSECAYTGEHECDQWGHELWQATYVCWWLSMCFFSQWVCVYTSAINKTMREASFVHEHQYVFLFMYAGACACMHTCKPTCVHTYKHTYIHTYIQQSARSVELVGVGTVDIRSMTLTSALTGQCFQMRASNA